MANHSIPLTSDLPTAWAEGLSYFFACSILNTSFYVRKWNYDDELWLNIETGLYFQHTSTGALTLQVVLSDICEGNVAGILWDIIDSQPTPEVSSDGIGRDDYSGPELLWSKLSLPPHPLDVNELLTNYYDFGFIDSPYRPVWRIYWLHGIYRLSLDRLPSPDNVTASISHIQDVTLTWNPAIPEGSGITQQIFRSTNPYSFPSTPVTELASDVNTWVDNNVTYFRTYYYKVRTKLQYEGNTYLSSDIPITEGATGRLFSTQFVVDCRVPIYPGSEVYAHHGGKIIVENGGELVIGDESEGNGDAVLFSVMDDSIYTAQNVIEVQPGGKVIGSRVKFDGLPCAIKSTGGQIMLDSAEFENCATAISVNSLADTVALSHCTFTGGEKAISSFDALDGSYQSITSCNFNNQSVKALELWKPKETPINGCNIVGNNTSTIGIDLYTTSSKVQIDNSEISNCTIGVNGLFSEAHFYNNLVHNNRDAGFVWSNGGGRIDHCNISNNGIGAANYKSGFFGYAASTIFTCNSFSGNDHHAVYLTGNSTTSFYDPDNSQVGSNDFSGILDFPMVLVDNSTPVFLYGENTFTGIIDQNGNHLNYYMQQVGTPFYLNLKNNCFDKDANPLGGLLPSNAIYWGLNTVFDSSSCGTNLGDYMSDLGGSLLRGDIFFSQDMLDSALYYYNLTLAQSGDSTAAGAAALQRLSELNPELPPVGDPYSMTKYYNESYGYDAMHEFLTADAYRDSILAYGNGDDSLRIEYDMLVSSLLRPTPASKRGDIAGYYQAQQSNRMTALSKIAKLSKAIKPPSHETAVAIPKAFALSSIYPNPFNNTTQIKFEVPKSSRVSVSVYDALGRLVKTLADKDYTTGSYRINWDGNNSSGMKVSTGIYFITMKSPEFVTTKKAVLLK